MSKEKTVNYTEEMVEILREKYEQEPTRDTIEDLANDLGKTTRSIVAKLSNMGIYQPVERTTKAGKPVVRKAELVAEVSKDLGVGVLASLEKASKADLEVLVAAVARVKESVEVSEGE